MPRGDIRILFIADTHLGFDLPFRPRIERRRRGHDFFANFVRTLEPAMKGEVDVVVHGGDLFYRSRVPEALIDKAMVPLVQVAETGVPVYVVPGNHERSRIPLNLWCVHPNLHIFDQPMTYLCEVGDIKLAISGFPFHREIRDRFRELVHQTGYEGIQSDIHILCMHQTVEGAQVGPSDYTFRTGSDIIRGSDIPNDFCIVLSGHIHRAQILSQDLEKRPMKAPILYPGSVERTSFAERNEDKKFTIVDVSRDGSSKGKLMGVQFIPLPTRPMKNLAIKADGRSTEQVIEFLEQQLKGMDADAIVRIQPQGSLSNELAMSITAERLRRIAPSSMNVSVAYPRSSNPIKQDGE
jgi:exonuclease SbcD